MNKQEVIGKYKVGQKVAIHGYIDAIDIENISDIENTTTLRIKTPVKTISVNPKYEGVVTDFNKSKPVVPQFVADLYESIKDDFEYKVYELCLQYKHRGDELPQGVAWWFGDSRNKPIETLVMMHKFGYEVEKEKLYYVNIPNVYHGDFGYSETHDNYSFYNKSDATEIRFELTESEIKLEHEWAWQFAKEVEE